MFREAKIKHKVSEESLRKLAELDDYVIEHFRLAFGNRIVKQLEEFVPAFVACGGTEIDGLDFILCHKILRKFEALNLSFIRDDRRTYHISTSISKVKQKESKEYLKGSRS